MRRTAVCAVVTVAVIGGLTVGCTTDTNAEAPAESTTTASEVSTNTTAASLAFSMRPVLDVVQESPALTDPAGDHPSNLDPETGLSDPDDVNAEIAYLSGELGLIVYVVGPAFLTGSDMKGGSAGTSGVAAEIVVVPEFTEEGGEKFRAATGKLAAYPVGSPQRQLAIVVDGVVTSAPAVAAGVDPNEGLDPNQVVITIGVSANPMAEAERLAAALQQ